MMYGCLMTRFSTTKHTAGLPTLDGWSDGISPRSSRAIRTNGMQNSAVAAFSFCRCRTLGTDWGACSNPESPFDGRVMTRRLRTPHSRRTSGDARELKTAVGAARWHFDPANGATYRDHEAGHNSDVSNPPPSRHVVIDGAGFIEQPWMAVIVLAQTGVTYENQTGGFACLPRQAEGYYVPVFNGSAFQSLRTVFEVELGGSGTHRYDRLPKELVDVLRQAVADIRMDSSIGQRRCGSAPAG